MISSIHWGEIAGILHKRAGLSAMQGAFTGLEQEGFEVIPASGDQAVRAALLKRPLKLAYADSFDIAITLEQSDAVFITADYDFKVVEHLVAIEFIGPKPSQTLSTTP